MQLSIHELFDKANKIENVAERVEYMKRNFKSPEVIMLKYALDPNVKWLLPEGAPPYRPQNIPDQHGRLRQEVKKLYLYLEGGNKNLKQLRREQLFIQLLEAVDPEDAKILLAAKDKKLPYEKLTKSVINKAFPNLV